MRALLVLSLLLLTQASFGQDTATAPAAAPATPAATSDAPAAAVNIPSAFKTGFSLAPSFSMFQRKVEQDATPTIPAPITDNVTGTDLELKGGYTWDFGLFAGLNVIYLKGKTNAVDMKSWSLAPAVGYFEKNTGLQLTASYHVVGSTDLGVGKYDKTSGIQVDLAYPIQLTSKINIGPQITWRRLSLTDGDAGLPDTKTKEFVPAISAWFYF